MAGLVTQLQVLAQESGCFLDISALIDLSICPNINVKADRPKIVNVKEDGHICITPTEVSRKDPDG